MTQKITGFFEEALSIPAKRHSLRLSLFLAVFIVGLSGIVAEVILLREFFIIFSGNEFSFGLVMGNWLILQAAGSYLAGKRLKGPSGPFFMFVLATIVFTISLPCVIFLIRMLKGILGLSIGETIPLASMFYSSIVILVPVATSHGALFAICCGLYERAGFSFLAGKVYAYETIGSIVGGLLSTFFLISHFNSFQISFELGLINHMVLLAVLPFFYRSLHFRKAIVAVILIFMLFFIFLCAQGEKVHDLSVKKQWRNLNVLHYENSLYGNICIIENAGQHIYFQNGVATLTIPIPEIQSVEEFVHLPLLIHPEPEKIMIISGGAGGVISEVLKHGVVKKITYVELDPLVLDLMKRFPTSLTEKELKDPKVEVEHMDGRLFLRKKNERYDLIFVGLSEPSTLQENRFFTWEFFLLARSKLKDGGALVFALPSALSYMSEGLRDLNSSVLRTVKGVFPYVLVFPGSGRNIFLCSDLPHVAKLDRKLLLKRLEERGVDAAGNLPWYIEQKLHEGWQKWFVRFLEGGSKRLNTDFQPLSVYYSTLHENKILAPFFASVLKKAERVDVKTAIAIVLFTLLCLALIIAGKKEDKLKGALALCISATGFTGMLFQLMLIFAFQALYGYVFSWIGALFAFFMAGAAFGAMAISEALKRLSHPFRLFLILELMIAVFAFIFTLIVIFLAEKSGVSERAFLLKAAFLGLSFLSGFLTGSEFPLANSFLLSKRKAEAETAGFLYACDLLGSFTGSISGGLFLLPVLGLSGSCAVIGFTKLATFFIIATFGRSRKNEGRSI